MDLKLGTPKVQAGREGSTAVEERGIIRRRRRNRVSRTRVCRRRFFCCKRIDSFIVGSSSDGMIRKLFSLMAAESSVVSGASVMASVVSPDESVNGKPDRSRSST